MNNPPASAGAGFSNAADGDVLGDPKARVGFARGLGITADWAVVTQVHGAGVVAALSPGHLGPADAIYTQSPGLPLAVFIADCAGVIVTGPKAVGVAHAGWRGVAAGVVAELVAAMEAFDGLPVSAQMSPMIGPCCFEVGPEVAARFPGFVRQTTWGTTSVDLAAAITAQLPAVEVVASPACTFHDRGLFSHRRQRTESRMAAVGWLL